MFKLKLNYNARFNTINDNFDNYNVYINEIDNNFDNDEEFEKVLIIIKKSNRKMSVYLIKTKT